MSCSGDGHRHAVTREEPAGSRSSGAGFAAVEQALRGLKYGHVTVFVQDGVVVLIERTEKTRLA